MARLGLLAASLFLATGCGGVPRPGNGQQACAPVGSIRRCPEGFECQVDSRCWQSGTGPGMGGSGRREGDATGGSRGDDRGAGTGMGGSTAVNGGIDNAPPYDAALPADAPPFEAAPSRPLPPSFRQVPAGQTGQSENYRVLWMSPPPPGMSSRQSETVRYVGGLVGATQR